MALLTNAIFIFTATSATNFGDRSFTRFLKGHAPSSQRYTTDKTPEGSRGRILVLKHRGQMSQVSRVILRKRSSSCRNSTSTRTAATVHSLE